jgi:hypothetical protein
LLLICEWIELQDRFSFSNYHLTWNIRILDFHCLISSVKSFQVFKWPIIPVHCTPKGPTSHPHKTGWQLETSLAVKCQLKTSNSMKQSQMLFSSNLENSKFYCQNSWDRDLKECKKYPANNHVFISPGKRSGSSRVS